MNNPTRAIVLILLVSLLPGCRKNSGPVYSGTMTISDESYQGVTWYNYGFSVPTGKKVSTINDPRDVITIMADGDTVNIRQLFFSTSNLNNSFFRYGKYPDLNSADAAFNNLKSFSAPVWAETADTVKANQIWIYRTHDEKYAKVKIVSTFAEIRKGMPYPYAECTFEWVYQPDGTQTFPGK